MKKNLINCLIIVAIFVLAGCASLSGEPTLEGVWYCDGVQYTFTSDGYYVREVEDYAEIGTYEKTETTLLLDGWDYDYILEGKTLILDGNVYARKANRAVNNTAKIAGIWKNDKYMIGFAKDGLVFSSGVYHNFGTYSARAGVLSVDSKSANYLIINDTLYIEDWKFINSYSTIVLERETSNGNNQTSASILCGYGPWFYQSDDYNGTNYSFNSNGTFNATRIVSGSATSSFSGTWNLVGNRINMSQGSDLSFGVIDNIPFGYSM